MPAPMTAAAAARTATIVVLLLTAQHVAARTVRDALFLSTFDARLLPMITMIGAVVSLCVAVVGAGWVRRLGPGRVAPAALLGSAVSLLVIWGLSFSSRNVAAMLVYLHVAALAGLLLSLFWSVINERLDPNALRRHVGRIGIGASLGGLIGGGGAFAAASAMGATTLLPALAATHVAAAFLLRPLGVVGPRASLERAEMPPPAMAALSLIRDSTFLRDLAWLVSACAAASAVLDYLFKSGLQGVIPAEAGLIRVFALFHGAGALLTVLAQSLLLRMSLDRAGVARTVATLPGALAGGALFGLFVPGAGAYAVSWLIENVLRGSFFRSGYEMLFTPIPQAIKRGGKALVDIGASRVGDVVGSGICQACLVLLATNANAGMLVAIIVLGALGAAASVRLDRQYRSALQVGLRDRASEADISALDEDPYTRTMVLDTMVLRQLRQETEVAPRPAATQRPAAPRPAAAAPDPAPPIRPATDLPGPPADPLTLTQVLPRFRPEDLAEGSEVMVLRSSDIERVRGALQSRTFPAAAISALVERLGDDRVAAEASAAIRRTLPDHPGALAAALRDPSLSLASRRRLPRLLRSSDDPEVRRALFDSLFDERFDVRFAAAKALSRLHTEKPDIAIDRERVFAAVEQEIAAGRPFWESKNSFHDPMAEDDDASHVLEAFVLERSGRALEHVFTLLALVLDREPLQLAYHALNAQDETLRGYALEYLEVELPPRVRGRLRPFLGIPEGPAPRARSREDALADLVQQNQTIRIRIDEIRKRIGEGES